MTEQRDWYLSMLGISQYRQRPPGVAVFASAPVQAVAAADQAVAPGETGADENSVGQPNSADIVSSLAGIRETLQMGMEPSPTKPAVTPVKVVANAVESAPSPTPTPTPTLNMVADKRRPDSQGSSKIDSKIETRKASQAVAQGEVLSFTLACWQPSDDLLLINGFTHGERASRVQLELLANMLRAIGQLPSGLPQAELLEWPLSPGGDSGVDGAKTQLQMFLLGRQQVRPYRWLLAMGDVPARLFDKGDTAQVTEVDAAETIFIPSLQIMLAEPLCKREVWQALRHLRGGQ